MAQTKLALELEQIYHRLYELRCEAIAVYWKDYVEPNPLENITRIQMLMLQYIADVRCRRSSPGPGSPKAPSPSRRRSLRRKAS